MHCLCQVYPAVLNLRQFGGPLLLITSCLRGQWSTSPSPPHHIIGLIWYSGVQFNKASTSQFTKTETKKSIGLISSILALSRGLDWKRDWKKNFSGFAIWSKSSILHSPILIIFSSSKFVSKTIDRVEGHYSFCPWSCPHSRCRLRMI